MPIFGRNLPRQRPGALIQTRTIDRPRREVEAQSRASTGFGLVQKTGPGGVPLTGLGSDLTAYARTKPGGIPGRDDTDPAHPIPGTADITIYSRGEDGLFDVQDEPAENLAVEAVGGDAWVIVIRVGRVWSVIWEECPA